jgi:ribonuclease P protein subunit RPR2
MTSNQKRKEIAGAGREVDTLFALAKTAAEAGEQAAADKHVLKARKLASKNRISLRKYNRVHCRKCSTYFTSKTLRVRTRVGVGIIYTCLRCDHVTRIKTTPRRKVASAETKQ